MKLPQISRGFLLLASLSLGGCVAQMQQLSAGQVGCPPDEVQIADDQVHFNSRTWQASCRGKSFFCTSAGGGQYPAPQTSCAELRPPVAGGAPAAAPAAPAAAPAAPAPAAPAQPGEASATGK